MSEWDKKQSRLREITLLCAQDFRKTKEEITKSVQNGIPVVDVWAMPYIEDAPPELIQVDCHFIIVGVNKKLAEAHKDEFLEILRTYPQMDRLKGGPSYIEVGAHMGSQDGAMLLFAIGEVLGFWKVVTPKVLGIEGQPGHNLALAGLVNISGFLESK